jgi:SAM-dependent methyltransferase
VGVWLRRRSIRWSILIDLLRAGQPTRILRRGGQPVTLVRLRNHLRWRLRRLLVAPIGRVVDRIVYRRRCFPDLASGSVWLKDLGLASPDRNSYGHSPRNVLKRILPESEVGPDDVFIDFGSGMGTVVFEAARYPFKRVIGVEIAPQLTRIARQVIAAQSGRLRCQEVDLVTADATDYEIPDDVTVAYFYDPFEGATFERVIQRLIASVDDNPRRVRLVYLVPKEAKRLESMDRIRFVRNWWRGFRIWLPLDYLSLYTIDNPESSR